MSDFAKILSAYGYKESQQCDVIRLLDLAGCFHSEQIDVDLKELGWNDIEIGKIKSVLLKAQTDRGVDPEIILANFNGIVATEKLWPEKLHNWLIKVTQREFFARKPGQERWQQETGQWMKVNETEARVLIARLGLIDKIDPKMKTYRAAAVFGSTYPNMIKRLEYLRDWIDLQPPGSVNIKHLYLLGGERPADKAVDGGEEFLKTLGTRLNIDPDKIMESHLFQEAYSVSKGKGSFAEIPFTLINAPRGGKPRPNTIDTLDSLAVVILKDDTIDNDLSITDQNIFFVSRAPHIRSQAEDVNSTFAPKFPGLKIEVVGGACDNTIALNQVMGAFGGALFGGYVRVAHELGSTYRDEDLKAILKTLSFGANQKPVLSSATQLEKVKEQFTNSSIAATTTIATPVALTHAYTATITTSTSAAVSLEQGVDNDEQRKQLAAIGGMKQ